MRDCSSKLPSSSIARKPTLAQSDCQNNCLCIRETSVPAPLREERPIRAPISISCMNRAESPTPNRLAFTRCRRQPCARTTGGAISSCSPATRSQPAQSRKAPVLLRSQNKTIIPESGTSRSFCAFCWGRLTDPPKDDDGTRSAARTKPVLFPFERAASRSLLSLCSAFRISRLAEWHREPAILAGKRETMQFPAQRCAIRIDTDFRFCVVFPGIGRPLCSRLPGEATKTECMRQEAQDEF
jgi:hypothetical protein